MMHKALAESPNVHSGRESVKRIDEDLQRLFQEYKVSIEEEKAPSLHRRLLTGRQIAYMIFDHFKLSEAKVAVRDIGDFLNIDLKGDNLKAFDTLWDETSLGMPTRSAQQTVGNVQIGEAKSYNKVKKNMIQHHLDQKSRELGRCVTRAAACGFLRHAQRNLKTGTLPQLAPEVS